MYTYLIVRGSYYILKIIAPPFLILNRAGLLKQISECNINTILNFYTPVKQLRNLNSISKVLVDILLGKNVTIFKLPKWPITSTKAGKYYAEKIVVSLITMILIPLCLMCMEGKIQGK